MDPARPSSPAPRLVALAILGVAAALRITHLTWGLPSLLEEAMPLRQALRMIDPATGRVDLNPHFFNYPSLAIYLHLLVVEKILFLGRMLGHYTSAADLLLAFQVDPGPLTIGGRLLHTFADVATVWAVWRIGRRVSPACGALAALLVAFSPVMIRTQNTIIVDTLAAALLAWSVERLVAWRNDGRARQLALSALLLGLAASAKYLVALCGIPMLWMIAERGRERFALRAAGLAAIALLAFALTSPYVFLDAGAALRDIVFEREHLAVGHLGGQGSGRLLRNLGPLASIGPAAIAFAVVSPLMWRDPVVGVVIRPALLFAVFLIAPTLSVRIDAERYLAPALPMLALLAAAAGVRLAARVRARGPVVTLALLAVTLAPVVVAGTRQAAQGRDDTQRRARVWCERNLPARALIIEEGWAAPLVSRFRKDEIAGTDMYRLASANVRARFDRLPARLVVSIPLSVTGRVELPAADGRLREVQAIDLNQASYVPVLYAAADYVVTSSAVRGRYEADSARFARALRFYALLDRSAARVAAFTPSFAVSGPEIRVYRITPATRQALRAGGLGRRWWLPAGLGATDANEAALLRAPETRRVYAAHFWKFAGELGYASLLRGDATTAEELAAAALAVDSMDVANGALLRAARAMAGGDSVSAVAPASR